MISTRTRCNRHRAASTLASICLASACAASIVADTEDTTMLALDNGMRIVIVEAPGNDRDAGGGGGGGQPEGRVAIIAHFGVGDVHDPPGASGLSHLVEHLFVTAAAGDTPSRTYEALFRGYPQGHTAQTAFDFTIIGAMFEHDRLEAELADLAARISDLRIEEADLAREKPRMMVELRNMYGGIPSLAAINHGRMRAKAMPDGLRRGGIEADIEAITLDTARAWHAQHYNASNLILTIVGAVDAAHVRALAEQHFAPLPEGAVTSRPADARALDADDQNGGVDDNPDVPTFEVVPIDCAASAQPMSIATLAFAVPQPGDEDYAAYLAVLGSIMGQLQRDGLLRMHAQPTPIFVAPLDDPTVLALNRPAGDDPAQTIAGLRAFVARAIAFDEATLATARQVVQGQLGWAVGITDAPVFLRTANPYPIALATARHLHVGTDIEALRAAWRDLTVAEVTRAAQRIFGPTRGAAIIVEPR
jgi:zinc protease